jgi:hypothetical protein
MHTDFFAVFGICLRLAYIDLYMLRHIQVMRARS